MGIKSNPCKECQSIYHTAMYHKPKKPIKRTAIKQSSTKSISVKKIANGGKASTLKKKKSPTRSQLVKKLDKVFSQYIRLRTADEFGNVTCVTSGLRGHWKTMQAGHFYTRGRYPTRWDETNVHVQSVQSNIFLKGDYINYTRFMIDKYGREYVDELEIKSKSTSKISTPQLKEMIAVYEQKVSTLIGNK
jgi:hypothetical protein